MAIHGVKREKKQFFNTTNSKKNTTDRNDKDSVRCLTCVCLPRSEMPDGFFDLLNKSAQDGTGHGND